ncbi:divalent-cation tolerance protein CutA [Chlorobium sp. KB01]|uniref:divalent-cation tolerance protein CutA n=1 Tax=Chlorobium sp. KB01 TaxID=1917528 RepID=UPI000976200D|nr:divalent-cation tolerance protein CutA [Chlorobium sp. KB01]
MKIDYCMVITTTPDREEAEHLAEGILENRLAACIQMADIRSFFLWEGAMQKEDEVVLSIKTTEARYSELEAYILEFHPYDVPEIIKLQVTGGLPGYLNWLDSTTGNEKQGSE